MWLSFGFATIMDMVAKPDIRIQKTLDNFISRVFLRFIPHSVKPNYITIIRFALVPVVYLLLESNNLGWALLVFTIAASTDFIDGAMARTRNQITDVGKVIDPLADKLLILSVLSYIGFKYLIIKIFFVFIVLELIAVLAGALFSFAIGKSIGANIFGKIKMILQSFSVGMFVLGIAIDNNVLIDISEMTLLIALFFAVLAGLENVRLKFRYFRNNNG